MPPKHRKHHHKKSLDTADEPADFADKLKELLNAKFSLADLLALYLAVQGHKL